MKKSRLLTLTLLLVGAAVGGNETVTATQTPDESTLVTPLIEANSLDRVHTPSGETYYNRALRCLLLWRTSVDKAIVTTHPDITIADPVIRGIVDAVRPMQIIPGVQVAPALGRLDNVDGWRQIAETVRKLREITGSDTFMINAETALIPMRQGGYVPDWDKVREGLALLPADVYYIWYPSISCWVDRPPTKQWCADDLKLQTEFLECVVETLPDVTLVTFEHDGPDAATCGPCVMRYEYVKQRFRVPTYPIVYFYDVTYFWKVSQFSRARDTCRSPEMAVYLGSGESYDLSRHAPRVLRKDLEQRLTVARDEADQATQRAEVAEKLVASLREHAAAVKGTLTRACDAIRDFTTTADANGPKEN